MSRSTKERIEEEKMASRDNPRLGDVIRWHLGRGHQVVMHDGSIPHVLQRRILERERRLAFGEGMATREQWLTREHQR